VGVCGKKNAARALDGWHVWAAKMVLFQNAPNNAAPIFSQSD